MRNYNLILDVDSYKTSHYKQYPPDTEKIFSYIEARDNAKFSDVVFFGLQYFLMEYLSKEISVFDIEEAEREFSAHGVPFNREGWLSLWSKYGGKLPLRIKAVPEGTVLKKGNVLVTVENTDPEFPWLTSYIETALLRAIWYPCTVATISRYTKKIIKEYLDETCDNPEEQLPFKLHDFGARGVSSYESAQIGGAAHLVNFLGTDTVPALAFLADYYSVDYGAGFSIPATEHSTVTAWGRGGEAAAYRNMVEAYGGKGTILACVSDSYDIYDAVRNIWCSEDMKRLVKEKGCTVVIRPDSGDPVAVVMKLLEILEKKFGMTVNKKGYKVLNPGYRLIQGDGMDLVSISRILGWMEKADYSAENIAFGMGAGLLQNCNRDTLSFAMKASALQKGGEWFPIGKEPITDKNKSQKLGLLTLRQDDKGEWYTSTDLNSFQDRELMRTVFENGKICNTYTLKEIRERAKII